VRHIAGQFVTQLLRVLGGQVDLVDVAVEGKRHGLVCGAAVEVVEELTTVSLAMAGPFREEFSEF